MPTKNTSEKPGDNRRPWEWSHGTDQAVKRLLQVAFVVIGVLLTRAFDGWAHSVRELGAQIDLRLQTIERTLKEIDERIDGVDGEVSRVEDDARAERRQHDRWARERESDMNARQTALETNSHRHGANGRPVYEKER